FDAHPPPPPPFPCPSRGVNPLLPEECPLVEHSTANPRPPCSMTLSRPFPIRAVVSVTWQTLRLNRSRVADRKKGGGGGIEGAVSETVRLPIADSDPRWGRRIGGMEERRDGDWGVLS